MVIWRTSPEALVASPKYSFLCEPKMVCPFGAHAAPFHEKALTYP